MVLNLDDSESVGIPCDSTLPPPCDYAPNTEPPNADPFYDCTSSGLMLASRLGGATGFKFVDAFIFITF